MWLIKVWGIEVAGRWSICMPFNISYSIMLYLDTVSGMQLTFLNKHHVSKHKIHITLQLFPTIHHMIHILIFKTIMTLNNFQLKKFLKNT